MDPMLAIITAGIVAGLIHVISGADHLAALMPLSVGRRWRAGLLGVRWGIGHTLGVVAVALLAVALRQQLDLAEVVGGWAESLVGLMLIAIGAFGLRRAARYDVHDHRHAHEGEGHAHLHAHARGSSASAPDGTACDADHDSEPIESSHHHAQHHTAFFAGVLHGVAGTSHFLGVLPAVALPTWLLSTTYLAAYGTGSIVAMGGFAAIVGVLTSRRHSDSRMIRGALYATSGLAIVVGIAWLVMPMAGLSLP